MADAGRALQWTGYGSLDSAMDFNSSMLIRPLTPVQPFMQSQAIPQTPPLWSSPSYSAPSPSETASPVTPSASFASFSPTAFHSSPLNSSKPSLYSTHPFPTASPVNSLRSRAPSSPSGSPYALRTPERLPIELTSRPGPLVPQKAYNAPFLGGKRPMQIGFQFVGGVPGVPMRLLQDTGAMDLPIEGASSTPFPQSVASTITLRIWWPGYVQYARRMTMRKATGLLMRSQLAMAVTEVYKEFIEEGREDPKECGQAKWRVGRSRITINDLVLLRMFQVSQGSWQADVRLENEM